MITIDEDGKTGGIDDNQAKMLIIGMFVSRSLITTVSREDNSQMVHQSVSGNVNMRRFSVADETFRLRVEY